ncbi:hypothetical protein [Enterovibrio norvegicus]|uniref:Uncharacterized protein n=1 Tax=Enterovibrio norvegicus DSM 15893 TaxID=1121869 RepID=A0A1I5VI49_9GAMM|nr:hypothetical protein [Enterovibrio norvegicus]SFQ07133.1 hypothetical protein SAMN03084138_03960 [Enterovibrio norvegicus DSM 15893]
MKYKLTLREITESDINVECPFPPDNEFFQEYVAALAQDLEKVDVIASATPVGAAIIIEVQNDMSAHDFRQKTKPVIQIHWDKLRVTDLTLAG